MLSVNVAFSLPYLTLMCPKGELPQNENLLEKPVRETFTALITWHRKLSQQTLSPQGKIFVQIEVTDKW